MLEPTLGAAREAQVPPVADGETRNAENANAVTGQLVLHAGVSESEIMSWAEVTADR